jgi:mono/diheme cytochrome c family protein
MRSSLIVALLLAGILGAVLTDQPRKDAPQIAPASGPAGTHQSISAGDPIAGKEIAEKLCVSCHALGDSKVISDKTPNLAVVARDPAKTRDYFRAFLSNPHPPMPPIQLTTIEIENLSAYLVALGHKPVE